MVTAEMEDDDDVVILDDHRHDSPTRDLRSPRLRHTHHVLSQLRAYLSSTPDELNATLRCCDGDFLTNKILLAAMSDFLRSVYLFIVGLDGSTGFVPEKYVSDLPSVGCIWNALISGVEFCLPIV